MLCIIVILLLVSEGYGMKKRRKNIYIWIALFTIAIKRRE